MTIHDSRRLTGPGLYLDGPGAILDVHCAEGERDALVAAWRRHLGRLLAAVGWEPGETTATPYRDGAFLAFAAPTDELYAATWLGLNRVAQTTRKLPRGEEPMR